MLRGCRLIREKKNGRKLSVVELFVIAAAAAAAAAGDEEERDRTFNIESNSTTTTNNSCSNSGDERSASATAVVSSPWQRIENETTAPVATSWLPAVVGVEAATQTRFSSTSSASSASSVSSEWISFSGAVQQDDLPAQPVENDSVVVPAPRFSTMTHSVSPCHPPDSLPDALPESLPDMLPQPLQLPNNPPVSPVSRFYYADQTLILNVHYFILLVSQTFLKFPFILPFQ